MRAARRDPLLVAGVALSARLAVVAWAGGAFPPTADGSYYHTLAVRIASGDGYTWRWPDGVVTPAAHYPVGYPAMLALAYALLGASPVVGMLVNALVGAAGAVASWSLVRRASSARSSSGMALAAGLAVALHPALVPYTAAIMTEGVTASLLAVAAAVAARAASPRPHAWIALAGAVIGVATLVRPQSVVLAPVLGWLVAGARADSRRLHGGDAGSSPRRGLTRRAAGAALATAVTLAVCAPWTARNCVRMGRCALVSANGGWNLAIGAQTESGGWRELAVPDACKTVFEEAAKDACFGREATKAIARDPRAWIARIPAKLRVTFDYFGAAPWYLHAANALRFPAKAKLLLGAAETVVSRLLLAAALVAVLRLDRAREGPARLRRTSLATTSSASRAWRARGRGALVLGGLVACMLSAGVLAYLALALAVLALGRRALGRAPLVVPFTAAVLLTTAATHAVFFGAGRYGLVVVPFVTALAFVRPRARGVDLGAAPILADGLAQSGAGAHALPVDAVQAIAGPQGREESPSSTEHDAG